MKQTKDRFFKRSIRYLAALCCSLLLLGSIMLSAEKHQSTVSVYAAEEGVTDFVSRLYTVILERTPDESGLAEWTGYLQDGTFTGAEVAEGFIMSDEFLNKEMSNEDFVQILYSAFFGREADAAGLETWVNFLDEGYRKSYVFAGFANSTEFGSLCEGYGVAQGSVPVTVSEQQPNLSDEEYNVWLFVERMYTEVLNRTPDMGGIKEWVDYLQDDTFSGAEVSSGFILSEEFQAKEMTNEEYVQIMYRAFFGREADPSGLETWVNALETSFTKEYVFAGFANSDEFGVLCENYGITQGEVEIPEITPTPEPTPTATPSPTTTPTPELVILVEGEEVTIVPEGVQNFGLEDGGMVSLEFNTSNTMTSQSFFDADGNLREKHSMSGPYMYRITDSASELVVSYSYYSNKQLNYQYEDGRNGGFEYIETVSLNSDGTLTIRYKTVEDGCYNTKSYYETGVLMSEYNTIYDKDGTKTYTKDCSYTEEGHRSSCNVAEYENGKAVLSINYNAEDVIESWRSYEYYEGGATKKAAYYLSEGTAKPSRIYEYYENGEYQKTENYYYNSESGIIESSDIYCYDEEGNYTYSKRCNYAEGRLSSYTEVEYENGKIVKETRCNAEEAIEFWRNYEYYESGAKKKEVCYLSEGTDKPSYIYEYYENGNYQKIENCNYDEKGSLTSRTVREYYESGAKKKNTYYPGEGTDKPGYSYEYYENGEYQKTEYYGYYTDGKRSSYQVNEYYESGENKKAAYYLGEGTDKPSYIYEYDENGEYQKTENYNYDEEGNRSSGTVTEYENGKKVTEAVYDAEGRCIVYRYDADGNVISESKFNADGTEVTPIPAPDSAWLENVRGGNSSYGYEQFAEHEKGNAMQAFYYELFNLCERFWDNQDNVEATDEAYIIGEVSAWEYNITDEEAMSIWAVFCLENPRYYWLSNSVTIQNNTLVLCIDEAYAAVEYRESCNAAIDTLVENCSTAISGYEADVDIALGIHDYILEQMTYAYESDGSTPQDDIWAHNITGCAQVKSGVCEAYAKTYQMLCLLNGIDCITAAGKVDGEAHAWNIIKLDDAWYGVDCTWDDSSSDTSYYFGMSQDKMSAYTANNTSGTGVNYLYNLPELSVGSIQFVELYENDMLLGQFFNIDAAFEAMVNKESSYEIKLAPSSDIPNSLLYSGKTYDIYSTETPEVEKLTITGNLGGNETGNFWVTGVNLNNDVYANSDVVISNVNLKGKGTLNLDDNTLITAGYFCGSYVNIQGNLDEESGSVIDVQTSYETELYGNVSVHTVQSLDSVDFRGNAKITKLTVEVVRIDPFQKESVIEIAEYEGSNCFIGDKCKVTFGTIYATEEPLLMGITFGDIAEYPELVINEIQGSVKLSITGERTTIVTDIYGNVVNKYTEKASPLDLECPIITINNSEDFDKMSIGYEQAYHDVSDLYMADESGNVILKEYSITDGIYVMEDMVIGYAEDITSVTIPEGITKIHPYAMNGENVEEIYLPSTVMSICAYAFWEYEKLSSIVIPSGVTEIGTYAFAHCDSLEQVEIPSSVTSIDTYAFLGCSENLKLIVYAGSAAESYAIENNMTYEVINAPSPTPEVTITPTPSPTGVPSLGEFPEIILKENTIMNADMHTSEEEINSYVFEMISNRYYRFSVMAEDISMLHTAEEYMWLYPEIYLEIESVTKYYNGYYIVFKNAKPVYGIDVEHMYAIRTGDTSYLDEQELATYEELLRINEELGLDEMETDMEKIKSVHDYLVLNTAYDEQHVANDEAGIPNESEDCHYVEGTLLNGLAVCSGYASTFRLFMELQGIHCDYITNATHGWNAVELDGKWYIVDVTWDDPVPDVEGRVLYTYFMVPEEVIIEAGGHDNWTCECGVAHVCDSDDYALYPVKDYVFTTEEGAREVMLRQADQDLVTLIYPADGTFTQSGLLQIAREELGITGSIYYYSEATYREGYNWLRILPNYVPATYSLTSYDAEETLSIYE